MAYIWTHEYMGKGSQNGVVIELDDGTLLNGDYNACNINKSIDGGKTWVRKSNGAGGHTRLRFVSSKGHIFFGSNMLGSTTEKGTVKRSTDNGETWSIVLTVDSNAVWNMVEDDAGNLFVSEYSGGAGDSTEPYAYNVWKSTDDGVTWARWHQHAQQSTPGAKDEMRHIHGLYRDSNNQIYVSYGDTPGYGGDAGKNYKLNTDGTMGQYMGLYGNGVLDGVEADNGKIIQGGDLTPMEIYSYDSTTNTYSIALTLSDFGSKYSSAVYRLAKGRDGVIYARVNNEGTGKVGAVFASADNGVTWHLLDIQNFWGSGTDLYVNPNGKSKKVYISNGTNNYTTIPDFTRSQLNSFTSTGGRLPVDL